ncbi:hypothetical protein ABTX81_01730 [Kitasatospora sp. NPDC097605]|uniref:hypothetical protein n=1 Tax=Kitasatospora sp. NPDC097605 TaxID=3157226 RepID=UPI003317B6AE
MNRHDTTEPFIAQPTADLGIADLQPRDAASTANAEYLGVIEPGLIPLTEQPSSARSTPPPTPAETAKVGGDIRSAIARR